MNLNKFSLDNFKIKINSVTTPLPGSIPYRNKYRLCVKQKFEGLNIIEFCLKALPRSTKNSWFQKLKNNELYLDGKVVNGTEIVKGGHIIELML